MHDHKKTAKVPLTAEQKAREAELGERYQGQLAFYASGGVSSLDSADACAAQLRDNADMLLLMPQAYSLYNCRRELLQRQWLLRSGAADSSGDSGISSLDAAELAQRAEDLTADLKLNSQILKQDYKVYSAFVHRRWIAETWIGLATAETDLLVAQGRAEATAGAPPPTVLSLLLRVVVAERRRCEELLLRDERNFHVWNYWRWAMGVFHRVQRAASERAQRLQQREEEDCARTLPQDTQPASAAPFALFNEEETVAMEFTSAKINENFSNYSAWHQRALTLSRALARWDGVLSGAPGGSVEAGGETQAAAAEQLYLVLRRDMHSLAKAIYCDPNDQSAWFYAPFVVRVFERYWAALLPRAAAASAATSASAGDGGAEGETAEEAALAARCGGRLPEALVELVLDLQAEESRLGEGAECYFPLYFLCTLVMQYWAPDTRPDTRARVAAYARTVRSRLYPESTSGAQAGEAAEVRVCVRLLTTQLETVDPMRCGMYQSFREKAEAA